MSHPILALLSPPHTHIRKRAHAHVHTTTFRYTALRPVTPVAPHLLLPGTLISQRSNDQLLACAPLLAQNRVDYASFLMMSEADLRNLGITGDAMAALLDVQEAEVLSGLGMGMGFDDEEDDLGLSPSPVSAPAASSISAAPVPAPVTTPDANASTLQPTAAPFNTEAAAAEPSTRSAGVISEATNPERAVSEESPAVAVLRRDLVWEMLSKMRDIERWLLSNADMQELTRSSSSANVPGDGTVALLSPHAPQSWNELRGCALTTVVVQHWLFRDRSSAAQSSATGLAGRKRPGNVDVPGDDGDLVIPSGSDIATMAVARQELKRLCVATAGRVDDDRVEAAVRQTQRCCEEATMRMRALARELGGLLPNSDGQDDHSLGMTVRPVRAAAAGARPDSEGVESGILEILWTPGPEVVSALRLEMHPPTQSPSFSTLVTAGRFRTLATSYLALGHRQDRLLSRLFLVFLRHEAVSAATMWTGGGDAELMNGSGTQPLPHGVGNFELLLPTAAAAALVRHFNVGFEVASPVTRRVNRPGSVPRFWSPSTDAAPTDCYWGAAAEGIGCSPPAEPISCVLVLPSGTPSDWFGDGAPHRSAWNRVEDLVLPSPGSTNDAPRSCVVFLSAPSASNEPDPVSLCGPALAPMLRRSERLRRGAHMWDVSWHSGASIAIALGANPGEVESRLWQGLWTDGRADLMVSGVAGGTTQSVRNELDPIYYCCRRRR